MTSSSKLQAYWERYTLNPTKVLDVEPAAKAVEENAKIEIELANVSDENSNSNLEGRTNQRSGDDSIVNILDEPVSIYPYSIHAPRILQKHFKFMGAVGMFPNKYDGKNISRVRSILQQVVYGIFCSFSIIDAIKVTKQISVDYVKKGNLNSYTTMAYMVLRTSIRLYFACVLVFKRENIVKIQKIINEIMMSVIITNEDEVQPTKNRDRWILGGVWIWSFVESIVVTFFGYASFSFAWSIQHALRVNSYEFRQFLWIWTSNSTEVERIKDYLWDEYDGNVTTLTAFYAVSNVVLEVFGRIYDIAAIDILLITVIIMYTTVNDFKFEKVVPSQSQDHSDIVWKHYKHLQRISEIIDSAFGHLFKLLHFSNLITLGYFLLLLTTDTSMDLYFLFLTVDVLKVGLIYFIAAKTSNKNKSFRVWIQENYMEQPYIIVENKRLKTSVVLDELTTKPIGIGSDNFHIDESFVIKFIGFVISYFMFLAQSKEKKSD